MLPLLVHQFLVMIVLRRLVRPMAKPIAHLSLLWWVGCGRVLSPHQVRVMLGQHPGAIHSTRNRNEDGEEDLPLSAKERLATLQRESKLIDQDFIINDPVLKVVRPFKQL